MNSALVVSAGIAIAGALITSANVWIAYNRLRLDLFERRLRVFNAASDHLNKSMTQKIEHKDNFDFYMSTRDAQFIFAPTVNEFLIHIEKTVFKKEWLDRQAAFAMGAERDKKIEDAVKLFEDIQSAQSKLDQVFSPYLASNFSKRGFMIPKWLSR
jgi:hypothetical protein